MSNWNENIGWKGINLPTVRQTNRLIAVRDRERHTQKKREFVCERDRKKYEREI